MIGGKTVISEKQYRSLELDSYSSLSKFAKDPKKYYKKYILGEDEQDEEEDTKATTIGSIVHTLLLEPDEFHNKFYESNAPNVPTGMMLDFVNALYKHTRMATNEDGVVTEDFGNLCKRAYQGSGYKISFERVLKNYMEEFQDYYVELRESRPKKLTVVSQRDMENAENVTEELRMAPNTSWLFSLESDKRYEVFNEFKVEEYILDGLELKSMPDKVIADHEKKEIDIYDLKVTWNVNEFLYGYFLKNFLYIQAVLYRGAVKHAIKSMKGLENYVVNPIKFIVADSINYYSPLVYETTLEDYVGFWEGFTHNGRQYKGVNEIIEDLKWAKENNIWKMSRKNYMNNGVAKLF